jgi:ABC-2 type transport system permease protein
VTVSAVVAIGRIAYDVHVAASALPALAITTAIGSLASACLGYALSTVISSSEAAQPVVLAITLPLYFISGVFVPPARIPNGLQHVAEVFPVQHLAAAMHASFIPGQASAISWGDLGVLAAWGLGGLVVALTRFSWSPRAATATAT